MRVEIQKRQFVNDGGNTVNYSALVISGTINGEVVEVAKSVGNADATLIRMLLNSDEDLSTTTSRGGKVDVKIKTGKKDDNDLSFLDD